MSALHDPHTKSTPSQRLAAAAHAERQRKIDIQAREDTGISCARRRALPVRSSVSGITEVLVVTESISTWIERQKQIPVQAEFKAPWFSIVSESEPIDDGQRRKPSIALIRHRTARFYQISVDEINSARRQIHIVRPRQVAMFLSKELTLRSFPEIGRAFGNRDHTTVLHACRKISDLIKRDAGIASDVDVVRASILGA